MPNLVIEYSKISACLILIRWVEFGSYWRRNNQAENPSANKKSKAQKPQCWLPDLQKLGNVSFVAEERVWRIFSQGKSKHSRIRKGRQKSHTQTAGLLAFLPRASHRRSSHHCDTHLLRRATSRNELRLSHARDGNGNGSFINGRLTAFHKKQSR